MKWLIAVLFVSSPLFAQNAPVNNPVIGKVYSVDVNQMYYDGTTLFEKLVFQIIRNPDGSKTFRFYVQHCQSLDHWELRGPTPGTAVPTMTITTNCYNVDLSTATEVGAVEAQVGLFLDSYGDALHRIAYGAPPGPIGNSLRPHFTTVTPTPPGNPYITMLDGLGNSLLKFDLTNFSILSQVVVPSTAGPYGVRPTLMGPQNEYWVANGWSGVAITNLASQKVTANIATPSVPSGSLPVAILFTNDGNTAFEAFGYSSPDASGNLGLLVVFDAVKQAVISTLPLKYAPSAFVMAPDGLTAYLLSYAGMITYYDVLSGTADLSLSTYTPGQAGGYPGNGTPVFVHPNGTRLLWNVGPQLESFDLAQYKVTAQFNSGLPTTTAISMTLSQDGLTAILSNGAGAEVFLDTQFGSPQGSFAAPAAAQAFVGPTQP
jgi:hypothetical protein